MQFHNVNLPAFIEVFAVGYPEFATSCISTISGREIRNSDNDQARQKYLIKGCKLSRAQFEQFNSFFRARQGRHYTFRFRDHADYQVTKQFLAKGDGIIKEIQLFKKYEDLVSPYYRKITKPVAGSVQLYVNDQPIELEINCQQGIVILSEPLKEADILSGEFMFDTEVRFGSDNFEYSYCPYDGSIELSTMELVEVSK